LFKLQLRPDAHDRAIFGQVFAIFHNINSCSRNILASKVTTNTLKQPQICVDVKSSHHNDDLYSSLSDLRWSGILDESVAIDMPEAGKQRG
jgi:hypothetical protein